MFACFKWLKISVGNALHWYLTDGLNSTVAMAPTSSAALTNTVSNVSRYLNSPIVFKEPISHDKHDQNLKKVVLTVSLTDSPIVMGCFDE